MEMVGKESVSEIKLVEIPAKFQACSKLFDFETPARNFATQNTQTHINATKTKMRFAMVELRVPRRAGNFNGV